jgi:renalase
MENRCINTRMNGRSRRPRVAIIGAGIAGLSLGRVLRRQGLDVVVFEKSRGPGGRMSTRRSPQGHRFDHGTQLITAETPAFQKQLSRWEAAGLIAPWTGRFGTLTGGRLRPRPPTHPWYVGVPRMSALTRALSHDLHVLTGVRISALQSEPSGWVLHSTEGISYGPFTAVISTAPAPQTAPLLAPHSSDLAAQADVEMLPCFSLMLTFDAPLSVPLDAADSHEPPLRWIARDSSKPGRDGAECWVLHASARWSHRHLHTESASVAQQLRDAFTAITGCGEPSWSALHLWRHGQLAAPPDPSRRCLWDPALGLGAAGDWLVGQRVESAWLSGMDMARTVLGWLRSAATLQQ